MSGLVLHLGSRIDREIAREESRRSHNQEESIALLISFLLCSRPYCELKRRVLRVIAVPRTGMGVMDSYWTAAGDRSFRTGVRSWKPAHSSRVTLHHEEAVVNSLETMSFWCKLDLDDVIANSIENQLTHRVDAQFAHDV